MGDKGPQKVPLNTDAVLALPVDPPNPRDASEWFLISRNVSDNNTVVPFLNGVDTFAEMGRVIAQTSGPKDFIYLAGWDFRTTTDMGGTQMGLLLAQASARGVAIRFLLWRNVTPGRGTLGSGAGPAPQNQASVDFVNALPTGSAVHDGRVLFAGAHHQKLMVVGHSGTVTGFCGGLDVTPDRNKWHDIHLRVDGPAAADLHETFVERWTEHPENDPLVAGSRPVSIVQTAPPTQAKGDLSVQIVRTYGNGSAHFGLRSLLSLPNPDPSGDPIVITTPSTYAFAPSGEGSYLNLLSKAIGAARKFIYMEDQYLVSAPLMGRGPPISKLLADKVANNPDFRVILLVARTEQINVDLRQAWAHRREFVGLIKSADVTKRRVIVCQYEIAPRTNVDLNTPAFVHSKNWIFDDEFFVGGSANCNRRGYTHDSEVGAGVFDPNAKGDRLNFVHQLRIRLWMKHLNPPSGAPNVTERDLLDPIAASRFWLKPPLTSPIEGYDEFGDTRTPTQATNPALDTRLLGPERTLARVALPDADADWDVLLDPDGS